MSRALRKPWRDDATDDLLAALCHTLLAVRTHLRARHPYLNELRDPGAPLAMTDLIGGIFLGRVNEILDLLDDYHDAAWAEPCEHEPPLPF